jgi:hypothetical protein
MRILTKMKKGVHERGSGDESSLAALCSMRQVELCYWFLGIILLQIKGRTLPSECRDSEQPMMLVTSHMILGTSRKQSSRCITSVSPIV